MIGCEVKLKAVRRSYANEFSFGIRARLMLNNIVNTVERCQKSGEIVSEASKCALQEANARGVDDFLSKFVKEIVGVDFCKLNRQAGRC
jgi:hypothetical protein